MTLNEDKQIKLIRYYLRFKKSPLADYAQDFVIIAKQTNLNPYLLVAISGQESTFATGHLCGTSNAFGFGVPCFNFKTFKEAISAVATTISTSPTYSGYRETNEILELGRRYNAVDYEGWARKVSNFISELEQFS